MRNRLFSITVLLLFITGAASAQLVGTNCYLQGAFVEIGILGNGSFGAPAPPPGYHPHQCCGSPVATPGAPLAEVYDYGHDGWTTGAPTFMGDYTYPGSPFEGWEVQANNQRAQAYQYWGTGFQFSGGGTMTGSGLTAYTNSGGKITNTWQGITYGGNLAMRMETRVDTTGSAVVMTVFFKNTSGTAIPGVYYWRSCDPDNDETWPGGGFPTDNVINFQNSTIPNPSHKVMVTATGHSSTNPPMTLATKDCRAVAVIYNAWGLTVGQDLAAVWNQTYGGAYYNVGVNHPGDIGIGIVWNLCTIAPGDSTSISYAYVFNNTVGVDDPGALPDPVLVVNGTPITSYPDTLDGCLLPGIDSVPLNIMYGDEKSWAGGHWTWSPSTGLTSTVGAHTFVRLSGVPGTVTYTVTGNDSSTCAYPCLNKTFIFTVHSCHLAMANAPCLGDALFFGMLGDSLGATYYWYGPGGFTSTLHNPIIYPTTWLDTGIYHVVRTIGGVHDTDDVHVEIHPLPVVTAASNIPLCGALQSTLNLFANLDSIGETFSWTGPAGFTSTVQNPSMTFDSTKQGTYTVTGTTRWGCRSTSSVDIWPGITPLVTYTIKRGCDFDTVSFNNTSINAWTYEWFFADGTPAVYTRNAMHIYNAHNLYNVKLHMTNGHCVKDTFLSVDMRHSIAAQFDPTPDTLCLGAGASVTFADLTVVVDTSATPLSPTAYAWYYQDGSPVETGVSGPTHIFNQAGKYPVKLVVSDRYGCPDSITHDVYVLQLGIKSFHDTLLCISQPLALKNVITLIPDIDLTDRYVYDWWESSPNLDDPHVQIPHLSGFGYFTDILTLTIAGVVPDGCPITDTINVNSVLGHKISHLTVSSTIELGNSVQLNANNEVFYYWTPNDGSLDNPNINNPVARPNHTTTYTVYGRDIYGCLDSAYVTVYVDTSTNTGIPTGFTPNNDGKNDIFRLYGSKFNALVEFRVFNRWGEEVFQTVNKDGGWDGTYHGVPQDAGVYNYLIIVAKPEGGNEVFKGNVTLIR